jgi:hypothetical protein
MVMNRRGFISTLLGLAGSAAVPAAQARQRALDSPLLPEADWPGPDLVAENWPQSEGKGLLLQESPLAGFQYHRGGSLWPLLREGDALRLVREPQNPFDTRAVAVHWDGWRAPGEHAGVHLPLKLGYLPRGDNCTVSQLLDRGQHLSASILALHDAPDPWRRLRLAVYWREAPHF